MANQADKGRSMEVMHRLCEEALKPVTLDLWVKGFLYTVVTFLIKYVFLC